MCESTVYSMDGIKIMEDVISIKIDGDIIDLADVLNQQNRLKGRIVEIDLDKHSIYLDLIIE
jgi:predicted RNA-binding protein